jgi:hypothetical protein
VCGRYWVHILAQRLRNFLNEVFCFSSVPLGKCWDSTYSKAVTASFHIFSESFFINHHHSEYCGHRLQVADYTGQFTTNMSYNRCRFRRKFQVRRPMQHWSHFQPFQSCRFFKILTKRMSTCVCLMCWNTGYDFDWRYYCFWFSVTSYISCLLNLICDECQMWINYSHLLSTLISI